MVGSASFQSTTISEKEVFEITYRYLSVTKVVFYYDQPFSVGWVGWVFSCSIDKKKHFRLVWLINLFNRTETRLKRLKKHW